MASVRVRWMAGRVSDVFGVPVDDALAALSTRDAAADVDALLNGSGPPCLHVFYQPKDLKSAVRVFKGSSKISTSK